MGEDYDGWLHEDSYAYFLSGLDHRIDAYLDHYHIADSDVYLVDIGGASLLLSTDQEWRPPHSDGDYAVSHSDHPNGSISWAEGACLESALAMYGFAPRGRYNPADGQINVFENAEKARNGWFFAWFENMVPHLGDVREEETDKEQLWREYAGNNLSIDKVDIFGGERALGTYPMELLGDHAEDIAVDGVGLNRIKTLSLPALTARKVYRATIDNQGNEDDNQQYDLHFIHDYVKNRMEDDNRTDRTPEQFREEFKDFWSDLTAANAEAVSRYEQNTGKPVTDNSGWSYFQELDAQQNPLK